MEGRKEGRKEALQAGTAAPGRHSVRGSSDRLGIVTKCEKLKEGHNFGLVVSFAKESHFDVVGHHVSSAISCIAPLILTDVAIFVNELGICLRFVQINKRNS